MTIPNLLQNQLFGLLCSLLRYGVEDCCCSYMLVAALGFVVGYGGLGGTWRGGCARFLPVLARSTRKSRAKRSAAGRKCTGCRRSRTVHVHVSACRDWC